LLQCWLQQADHLPIHVVDRGRRKQQGADRPTNTRWRFSSRNAGFPSFSCLRSDLIHARDPDLKTCKRQVARHCQSFVLTQPVLPPLGKPDASNILRGESLPFLSQPEGSSVHRPCEQAAMNDAFITVCWVTCSPRKCQSGLAFRLRHSVLQDILTSHRPPNKVRPSVPSSSISPPPGLV
jgi:hypothetical protein